MDLILASTSVYRAKLLQRLGIPFRQVAPNVDESLVKAATPEKTAEARAEAKAKEVASHYPDAIVIGSDQVCCLGEETFSKPGTEERAMQQLLRLAGHTHELHTALTLVFKGTVWRHTDTTRLTMLPLSEKQFRRYVQRDQPLDCAGSYKIESLGAALFASVETGDSTAIEGLPLLALCRLLREAGVEPLV